MYQLCGPCYQSAVVASPCTVTAAVAADEHVYVCYRQQSTIANTKHGTELSLPAAGRVCTATTCAIPPLRHQLAKMMGQTKPTGMLARQLDGINRHTSSMCRVW